MALAPSFVEMNIMRIGISCLLVFLAARVVAHVGDEIYPFLELLDEDLDSHRPDRRQRRGLATRSSASPR